MNNTFLYISLILFSISSAYYQTQLSKIVAFFLIYFILFIIIEFIDMYIGINLWNQNQQVSNCYDWFEHYLKKNYGIINGKKVYDLTENIYFNNFNITAEESLENKYNLIFNELNLSKGKTLLDCGSGDCSWLSYCKEKGVIVTGFTLSKEQQKVCNNKKIHVYIHDYRILDKNFINKFDAISLLGTTEHLTNFSGTGKIEQRSYKDHFSLFKVLKQYLKDDGKLLLTCLVQCRPERDRSGPYDRFQTYIMQRHYGGYYSTTELISKAIKNNGFTINSITDYTKDYHWISVAEPDHFGHWWIHWEEDPLDKILYFIKGIFTDQFLIHHWLYYGMDTWMWQFGGYQKTPLTDEQVENAIANLKYFSIVKNKAV